MDTVSKLLPYLSDGVLLFCVFLVYNIKEERIKFLQEQIKHEQNKTKIWNADEILAIIELKKTIIEESFKKQLEEQQETIEMFSEGVARTNDSLDRIAQVINGLLPRTNV